MHIRQFQAPDEPAVIELWRECGLLVPHNDPHRDIARKLNNGGELFLVGEQDEVVMASAMGGYDGHRGWVNYLAVGSAYRKRGYAAMLMRQLEALLLEQGCPKLNLQIRAGNREVIEFYASLGYAEDPVISMGKRLIADRE
ncbi:GNAT family acetyltransferase [Pseudohalioglobus sediminis]|uniref:GNAT family acetyltransferase n=1 Tax=Pseudohalioglobus sediminis TaxID=2606449 RepID=A0A5B0WUL0_9GAMM|nr:GNAT family acetyltransferase [Pseudohalioglobus sediminis]KAA1189985.1 GNAT family acetyltransferase [Pseudohalioglobus sediminis]